MLKYLNIYLCLSVCAGAEKQTLTSKLGNVIVTCSPLPTSSSPSHVVSMDAGLKSSVTRS